MRVCVREREGEREREETETETERQTYSNRQTGKRTNRNEMIHTKMEVLLTKTAAAKKRELVPF